MTRRVVTSLAVLAALVLVAAGCTEDYEPADGRSDSSAGSATTTTSKQAPCHPDVPATVAAEPVAGSTSDVEVTSFDGTRIRAHWFPVEGADGPRPTVLMGPGWGSPGDTDENAVGVLGAVSIKTLRDAGYNVLTWDPRGFGESGGAAQVDSPDFEARDVQYLLSWVSGRSEAELDAAADPTVGMVGGSYGGGIQFVTAAIDCRVDAIVPIIAWHSLGTSLYKSETVKQGWATILSGVARDATLDPMVTAANEQGRETGTLTPEQRDWFLARGPADRVADITAPAMVVGGTVDTLFTLDEDITNYRMLRDAGTPVSMFWFCGGHGTCLTDKGDEQRTTTRIIAWLDRWVKRDESIDVGPRFEFLDQDGTHYTGDDYPLPAGEPITASGAGSLELRSDGGSGPAKVPDDKKDLLSGIAGDIIPSPATNALDVEIPVAADAMVVGSPELTLEYSGDEPTGADDTAGRPTRAFAQIVDEASGLVVGNQITPVPLELDGSTHAVKVPLEAIAHKVSADSRLKLQIVATTTLYGLPRLGGTLSVTKATISLPTVTGYQPVG